MKRRKCIAVVVASAIAGIGTAISAATVVDARAGKDSNLINARLAPVSKEKANDADKEQPAGQPNAAPGPSSGAAGPDKPDKPDKPDLYDLGLGNLIQAGDLAAANFPAATSSVSPGDLGYLLSDCMKSGLGGITGNPVFSGAWESGDSQKVSESISTVSTEAVADRLAQQIVAWHSGTCGASTVSAPTRVDVAGGWIVRVELSQEQEVFSDIAIVKVGRNIGVVDARLLAYDGPTRDGLFNAAAIRLQ